MSTSPNQPNERNEDADLPTDGRSARALKQRAVTRQRILDATAAIFARDGFVSASVADILADAGVSRGTFYSHFESKEAALGAVLESFVASLAAVLHPVTTRSPEAARDELIANITRAIALLDDSPALSNIIFSYAAALPPELGRHLDRFFDGVVALIVRALTAGAGLGLVKRGDQRIRARLILGAFVEAARPPAAPSNSRPPRDDASRAALALTMLDFALSGVLLDPRSIAAVFERG